MELLGDARILPDERAGTTHIDETHSDRESETHWPIAPSPSGLVDALTRERRGAAQNVESYHDDTSNVVVRRMSDGRKYMGHR